MIQKCRKISKNVFTIEEFSKNEITKGKIHAEQFLRRENYKIHGHCHQKSLSTMEGLLRCWMYQKTVRLLFIIQGCCGRFFGYEKNIMKSVCKWEDTLFPKIRATDQQQLLWERVVATRFWRNHRKAYIQWQ
jgi:hypothetical protein